METSRAKCLARGASFPTNDSAERAASTCAVEVLVSATQSRGGPEATAFGRHLSL